MPQARISPDRIEEAARTVDPVFRNSPQVAFEGLSRDLVLKIETLNPIRCFKGRGTDFFVHCLRERTPLVTASAGNFGQGLAYAARRRNIEVHIFAAEQANPLKVERMRELGAQVVLAGTDFDDAKLRARAWAAHHGYRFVEDGLEPEITEGAGTIGVELLGWSAAFDAVLLPVGNGALVNGVGTWIKHRSPATRVIAVCAAKAPCMEISWRQRSPVATEDADTIADGLAVRIPVPAAVEDMAEVVDEFLLVEEAAIPGAMRAILRHTGMVVEPSAAAGVAAVLANRARFQGQLLATPLCGANVTEEQMRQWFWTPAASQA